MKSKVALSLAALGLLGLSYQNCGTHYQFDGNDANPKSSAAGEVLSSDKYFDLVTGSQYVCEPFGKGSTGSTVQSGLKASLRYLDQMAVPSDKRNDYTLTNYFSDAHPNVIVTDRTLYFSSVNTPGQNFDLGFKQTDGTYLTDNNDARLTEYFALEYNSILKLKASDVAGYYRITALSDDGAILEYQVGGVWKQLINSDGLHSLKVACADDAIYLDKTTELPVRLRYFQGPRNRIANQLIWQYVGTTSSYQPEKYCGTFGDNYSLDVNAVGQASANAFQKDMETRGWSVIAPDNFKLPNNEINPCSTNLDLQIGAFNVQSATNGNLVFSFDTSSAMTATVTVKDSKGVVVTTAGDSADTLHHQVSLSGLDTASTYKLDVVVKSDSLGVMYQRSYNLVPVDSQKGSSQ